MKSDGISDLACFPTGQKRQIDLKCSAKTIIHKLKYYEKNIIFSLIWRFDYNF